MEVRHETFSARVTLYQTTILRQHAGAINSASTVRDQRIGPGLLRGRGLNKVEGGFG
jgi:hypothetical protein